MDASKDPLNIDREKAIEFYQVADVQEDLGNNWDPLGNRRLVFIPCLDASDASA